MGDLGLTPSEHRNVAVTACARELTGFIWALLHGQVVTG